ncbi:uncharacterized protein MYCFIDRAFT_179579 [Pseudocercospora fijiensis CIRAD86]|uniref:Uncharacterized protein n=1 Tax=Pseudocercospora fijiensis (strain CIRAD86) TaxID=383855 RepID=M2YK45_PSEFD|nr:uncharacterized protein MYCFIDRAFT_179579 [Pseudocercospora fijiensis CIRAD86]EME78135.1 hypothetical protein MYCFIDRAFT_179579 [Pseudocercospora fijiensis CIRAD86]
MWSLYCIEHYRATPFSARTDRSEMQGVRQRRKTEVLLHTYSTSTAAPDKELTRQTLPMLLKIRIKILRRTSPLDQRPSVKLRILVFPDRVVPKCWVSQYLPFSLLAVWTRFSIEEEKADFSCGAFALEGQNKTQAPLLVPRMEESEVEYRESWVRQKPFVKYVATSETVDHALGIRTPGLMRFLNSTMISFQFREDPYFCFAIAPVYNYDSKLHLTDREGRNPSAEMIPNMEHERASEELLLKATSFDRKVDSFTGSRDEEDQWEGEGQLSPTTTRSSSRSRMSSFAKTSTAAFSRLLKKSQRVVLTWRANVAPKKRLNFAKHDFFLPKLDFVVRVLFQDRASRNISTLSSGLPTSETNSSPSTQTDEVVHSNNGPFLADPGRRPEKVAWLIVSIAWSVRAVYQAEMRTIPESSSLHKAIKKWRMQECWRKHRDRDADLGARVGKERPARRFSAIKQNERSELQKAA